MTVSFPTLPRRVLCALCLLAIVLVTACSAEPGPDAPDVPIDDVALRFVVLGDGEPKPLAEFPHTEAAVSDVNALAERQQIDFAVGVGDIAHDGTLVQYEAATPVLQALTLPFYPIMGNEEHTTTVERFLEYANRWNEGKAEISSPSYVQDHGPVVLVYASPDFGRDFEDDGIAWIKEQLEAASPKPVFLIVHGAQAGAYPENPEKGVTHPGFADIVAQPNLRAVISGDLHMDMDRVNHSKQIDGVHYLHIPALERTKIPDETRHTPMFRVFSVLDNDEVQVETYEVGTPEPLERHAYRFSLARAVAGGF